MPRYEILSEDAMAVLDRGWRRLVSETGIEFTLPEAVDILAKAGMRTEDERVFFDPDFILEQVAKAPKTFTLKARNPATAIQVGGTTMAFGPVYGPPFIRQGATRRDAMMDDFERLVRLTQ